MTITIGITLALLCSLIWVSADGLRKRLSKQLDALELAVCLHWIQLPMLLAAGATASIVTSGDPGSLFEVRITHEYWLPALPTIALNAVANVLFVRALQLSDLSLSIPYLSLTPVMALFTGWLVVGEVPTFLGLGGVLIIGFGALVLNPGEKRRGRFRPIKTLMRERGSLMMLGVAALWSFAVAFDKAAVAQSSPFTHAIVLAASGGVILEVLRRQSPSGQFRKRFQKHWLGVSLATASITLALFLQLSSYQFIEVSYVEAVKRSIGLIGSVLVGWFFFKEQNIRQRLAGVCVMAVGVCLVLVAAN